MGNKKYFKINKEKMKHMAAYSLLVLGGNQKPSAEDVEQFMKSCGVSPDQEAIRILISEMGGRQFHELVEEGKSKMAEISVGSGPARNEEVAKQVEEVKPEV